MKDPYGLIIFTLAVVMLAAACKKETEPIKEPVKNGPVYHGGKNGWYSRTFFAVKDGVRINARAYLKLCSGRATCRLHAI